MPIYTHDYDNSYYPAMPVVELQLWGRANQDPLTLTAIIDTGADATMIPLPYLKQLKARKKDTRWMSGTAGGRYQVDLYTIAIQIGSHRLVYVDAVGTFRLNEVILGRDLLNEFTLNLNAPAHVVEVAD